METSYQSSVAEAVKARGAREGWTPEQYAARCVCKLMEELSELEGTIRWEGPYPDWVNLLNDGGDLAREHFRDSEAWTVEGFGTGSARGEVVDLMVGILCLAQVIAEIEGEPFDVLQEALVKAESDVKRERKK